MIHKRLEQNTAALLVIDMQEKLFPLVDHPCEMLEQGLKLIEGCTLLNVPILVSEQYPKGLGKTIEAITGKIKEKQGFEKTTFSCVASDAGREMIDASGRKQWILMGIEAHVCVLQTARSLLEKGYEVVVANDAISSRSIFDFSTAIGELRDMGARITSTETILFELLQDSKHPAFKAFSNLIKS